MQPMQPHPTVTTSKSSRRRVRTVGLIALVVGLVAGGLCWYLSGQQSSDAVADLAPAPVGCDTTLEFDDAGVYTFYVETDGEVGEIDGNCDGADRDYEFTGDGLPRISLTLVDPDGDEVDLDRVETPTYEAGGAKGTGIRTADIDDAGAYVLTVEANADDVMVRVGKGREPGGGSGMLRILAMALAAIGVLSGVIGLIIGAAAGGSGPSAPSGPVPQAWRPVPGHAPANGPPTTAPNAPPYAWPPGTPPAPPSAPPQQGWGGGSTSNPLPPPGR